MANDLMKFLCDRCKTRYSIADERVRGKILKIRCKNCSAVITVREGMAEQDEHEAVPQLAAAGASGAVRSGGVRASTAAASSSRGTRQQSALADAFANVMSPEPSLSASETALAPQSLEEEWYVSIDGNQSGPFPLAAAQAWVAEQAPGLELFCWSEGFDDWLPVDKVSHFRGLRRKPEPPAPPPPSPLPRLATARAPTSQAPALRAAAVSPLQPTIPNDEETPKPLFAAALAKFEKEVQSETAAAAAPPTPIAPKSAPLAAATPSASVSKSAPLAAATPSPSQPSALSASPPSPLSGSPPSPLGASRSTAAPIALADLASGLSARSDAAPRSEVSAKADLGGNGSANGSANGAGAAKARTALPPPKPLATPSSAAKPAARIDARFDGGERDDADESDTDDAAAAAAAPGPAEPAEDDLAIGEVSRVVNLATLARAASKRTSANAAIPVARGTGSVTAVAAAQIATAAGEPLAPLSDQALADAQPPILTPAPRKRSIGLMLGLGVGAVALIGGLAVFFALSGSDDDDGYSIGGGGPDLAGLGYTHDNPTGPRKKPGEPDEPGPTAPDVKKNGTRPRNPGTGSAGTTDTNGGAEPGTGKVEVDFTSGQATTPLSPNDVISTSAKYQMSTQRCFERAIKNDPFLDVKKIYVDIKVEPTGVVSSVSLSSHQSTLLGTCLAGAIRGWRFRASTEGIVTQIPLVFEQR